MPYVIYGCRNTQGTNKPWHQGPQNDSIANMLYHLQWPTEKKKTRLPNITL